MSDAYGGGECTGVEMNAALGRYNEFVDIRIRAKFDTWHGTSGLRCLVCRYPVVVYRSRARNPFVRHRKGQAATRNPAAAKTARETFLHQRLKYWVRDELRNRGVSDAEVETPLGNRRPDVFGHFHGRGFAVEVQWSPLDVTGARARTEEMRAAGVDHVLWLTRGCNWVEQLPALGIKSFDPDDSDYRAHTGWLEMRPNIGLRVQEASVGAVLRQWVDGELAWACRDHTKAGWATVTDWEQHTKRQADIINGLGRKLASAQDAYAESQRTIAEEARQLREAHDQIDRATSTIDDQQHALAAARSRHATLTADLDTAKVDIDQARAQRDDLKQRHRKASDRAESLEDTLRETAQALATRTTILKALLVVCVVLVLAVLLT
ncbi:competence protein CoiA family protein [Nocardia asiatica]|uniref:competence protein CoiA family protein n=1 Tax=Nocardia asiatica TaxID=209252 RepID=UPI003EE40266